MHPAQERRCERVSRKPNVTDLEQDTLARIKDLPLDESGA